MYLGQTSVKKAPPNFCPVCKNVREWRVKGTLKICKGCGVKVRLSKTAAQQVG